MIKEPTVFVLGAGASQPYGFPSGKELVEEICRGLIGQSVESSPLARRLGSFGHGPPNLETFAQDLRAARRYSLDRFLEMRGGYLAIGKIVIAEILLQRERKNPQVIGVSSPDNSDADWYGYLFDQLIRKNVELFRVQARLLSIITFNFDRSFERALFDALRANYGMDGPSAAKAMADLEIVHVHGILGIPDWLSPHDPAAVWFGGSLNYVAREDIQKAVDLIKFVHEDADHAALSRAQELLRAATRICFLGFGYDEENLAKLDVMGTLRDKDVRGTVLGVAPAEQTALRRCFPASQIGTYDLDALQFLRTVDAILD